MISVAHLRAHIFKRHVRFSCFQNVSEENCLTKSKAKMPRLIFFVTRYIDKVDNPDSVRVILSPRINISGTSVKNEFFRRNMKLSSFYLHEVANGADGNSLPEGIVQPLGCRSLFKKNVIEVISQSWIGLTKKLLV